ncbi:ABC-2 type transport system ATP-binding protein [Ferrimonas sediminum]|uniref:ABC-2 type transport system ATP-binding protein n=1 Tax=Ferrimonas sediminum TaxID=718193 RepID=A0A1G8LX29_9GAMM|nr:ABC transporter ATP-binding protein [Ferrimonas sediminum]SDI60037.1 ABC-2 type transport system ATP-binding protein [Ferrimonas sediminum]
MGERSSAHNARTLLRAQELSKRFGDLVAVDRLNLSLAPGECFGLLGPNGAGKSTTLEMLEGILEPTSGKILFKERPLFDDYRHHIGIQFQATALPEHLSVSDCLTLFASLYRTTVPLTELAQLCRLESLMDQQHQTLSGGQRQRLLLALALINRPQLLFLDEPTTGLDPQARHNFWQLIRDVRAGGTTILLTTHYMDEAEQLCDRIAIMDHGRVLRQDTPAALIAEAFLSHIVSLPASVELGPGWPLPVQQRNGLLEFQTDDVNQVLALLQQHRVDVTSLNIRRPNLEDLFLTLTGHQLRS